MPVPSTGRQTDYPTSLAGAGRSVAPDARNENLSPDADGCDRV